MRTAGSLLLLAFGLSFLSGCTRPGPVPLYRTRQPGGLVLANPAPGRTSWPLLLGPAEKGGWDLVLHPCSGRCRLVAVGRKWVLRPGGEGPLPGLPAAAGPAGSTRPLLQVAAAGGLVRGGSAGEPLRLAGGAPLRLHSRCRPALADFDGDGRTDLVGLPPQGGPLLLWCGTGKGEFAAPRPLVHPAGLDSPVLAASQPGAVLCGAPPRRHLFVQVALRRIAPGPWAAGLFLRSPEGEEFGLELRLDPTGRFLQVRYEGWGVGRHRPALTAGRADGKWHRLALLWTGSRASIFWEGQVLHRFHPPSGGSWTAGVRALEGPLFCRDFQFTPPPGARGETIPRPDPLLAQGRILWGRWVRRPPLPHPGGALYHLSPEQAARGLCLESLHWDDDGRPDLLLAGPAFPPCLHLGRGRGRFTAPLFLDLAPAGSTTAPLTAGDLDEDGRPDLLLGYPDGTLRLYPGRWFEKGPR